MTGDEGEGREQTHKQSGHREAAATAAHFHSNSQFMLEEQLMRRLMLTRAILAHFLRLANFKRSRRSSAVVSLVLVQHLARTVRHQPKTGLFFPKPLVSSLHPAAILLHLRVIIYVHM